MSDTIGESEKEGEESGRTSTEETLSRAAAAASAS